MSLFKKKNPQVNINVYGELMLEIEGDWRHSLYGTVKYDAVITFPDGSKEALKDMKTTYRTRLTGEYYNKLDLYSKIYKFIEKGDDEIMGNIKDKLINDISYHIRELHIKQNKEDINELLKKPIVLNISIKADADKFE